MGSKSKYTEYIKSKEWKAKKEQVFDERGRGCEQCGSEHYLQVHHLTYERLGDEDLADLQILCYQCHMSKHDKYFNKFVLKKNPIKKKVRLKKPVPKKTNLLDKDFKTLSVAEKWKYLELRNQRDAPVLNGKIILTEAHIKMLETGKGGFTRKKLEFIGVKWPPKKGWKNRVVGKEVDETHFYHLVKFNKTRYEEKQDRLNKIR